MNRPVVSNHARLARAHILQHPATSRPIIVRRGGRPRRGHQGMKSDSGEQCSSALAISGRETARRHGRGFQDPNSRCWRGNPRMWRPSHDRHHLASTTLLPMRRKFEPPGLKGLAWASVELPQIMPKPNLTALPGGYRKTPVLQIGADICCDSQLIMRELERRYPAPSFYPVGQAKPPTRLPGGPRRQPSARLSASRSRRDSRCCPRGVFEDRARFSGRNIDPIAMMAAVPNLLDHRCARISSAGIRRWLTGACSCKALPLADLAAYHPTVLATEFRTGGDAACDGFPRPSTWAERIAAIGHGRRSEQRQQAPMQQGCHIDRRGDRRSSGSHRSEVTARPLPSRRTIPGATRLPVNWSLSTSMRS